MPGATGRELGLNVESHPSSHALAKPLYFDKFSLFHRKHLLARLDFATV
jgi:hypothetical protein